MRIAKLCLLAGLAALFSMHAWAGEIAVIANSGLSVSAVSSEDLKGVFLITKTSLADGSHVEPVLAKGGAAHEAFLKEYLGKTDAGLQAYYRSLVFTGKGSMPKMLPSDADVIAYVAKTKGAIGYVGRSAAAAGVKVLDVK